MSLRFWAPLCGDVEDRCGNERIYIADEDLVFDDSIRNAWKQNPILENTISGKDIYKLTVPLAYKINTHINFNQDFTFSWWVHTTAVNEASNTLAIGFASVKSDGSQHLLLSIDTRVGSQTVQYRYTQAGVSGTSSSSFFYEGSTIYRSDWVHYCVVRKSKKYYIYIDGNLVGSTQYERENNYENDYSNLILFMGEPWISTINARQTTQITTGTALSQVHHYSLSDVRFYDEALSPLEIRNLSLGLIVHYNFSEGNYNLLYKSPQLYVPTAYNAYQLQLTENLVEGETYTFQFWNIDIKHTGKTDATLGLAVYWGGGSTRLKQWLGTDYFTDGHADYLSFTLTITSALANGTGASNAWLNIYNSPSNASGERDMTIGAWKVEKGEYATRYRDISDQNNEMILDQSSNNRHLIKSNTNNPSLIYQYDSINNYTLIEPNHSPYSISIENRKLDHDLTISCWLNIPENPTGHATLFQLYGVSIAIDYPNTSNQLKINIAYFNQSNSGPGVYYGPFECNKWYNIQCVYSYQNKTFSVYINNQLKNMYNSTDFYIRSYNGIYTFSQATCKIADLRVYASALSEAELKVLTNHSTLADKQNNLFSGQFIEENNINTNITKSHTVQSQQIQEESSNNTIIKIYHNTPYKNYLDGGAKFCISPEGNYAIYNNLSLSFKNYNIIKQIITSDPNQHVWITYRVYSLDNSITQEENTSTSIGLFKICRRFCNLSGGISSTSQRLISTHAITSSLNWSNIDSIFQKQENEDELINIKNHILIFTPSTTTTVSPGITHTWYADNYQLLISPSISSNSNYPLFANMEPINFTYGNQLITNYISASSITEI